MPEQLTILLVEDLTDDVFFFRRTLQKTYPSAKLHVVETGREAIEYLANEGRFGDKTTFCRPDLVFLDLKMPEVSGFDLLTWMAKHFCGLPFQAIVLTSSDEPQDYKRALDLGAHGYFLKPISSEQLSGVLNRSHARAVAS
jgi:CheY-like chemotaxis protein